MADRNGNRNDVIMADGKPVAIKYHDNGDGSYSEQQYVATTYSGTTGSTAPTQANYTAGRAATAQPTAVTNGQLVGNMADTQGKQVTQLFATPELSFQSATTLTTTTSTAAQAAAGAGLRNYVTDIDIANTSATAVRVDILDGVTIILSVQAAAGQQVPHIQLARPKRTTANTALNVQSSAAVTDIRVGISGYIAP